MPLLTVTRGSQGTCRELKVGNEEGSRLSPGCPRDRSLSLACKQSQHPLPRAAGPPPELSCRPEGRRHLPSPFTALIRGGHTQGCGSAYLGPDSLIYSPRAVPGGAGSRKPRSWERRPPAALASPLPGSKGGASFSPDSPRHQRTQSAGRSWPQAKTLMKGRPSVPPAPPP